MAVTYWSSPFSLQGLCCSNGWSLYPGSQTPPQILDLHFLDTVWCVRPWASSSLQCLQSLLLPFHSLLLEPAGGHSRCFNEAASLAQPVFKHQQASPFLTHSTLYPHLVNEIESHGPLSDPHLLGLPVLTILRSDLIHAFLQPTSRFILLPIFLSLQKQQRGNLIWVHVRGNHKHNPTRGSTCSTFLYFTISLKQKLFKWWSQNSN